jgi:signal transduction histidine kinase
MRRPFISYAREDYETAVRLHDDLCRAGLMPWLDRKAIRAGEDWRLAIREGLRSATHVIALISEHSVNKRGFVQNELKQALELLGDMPPGHIYIIPVRLDRSSTKHERLNDLHRVDLFEGYEVGFEQILDSLRATSPSTITPITQPSTDRAAALIAHEIANSLGFFNVYLNIIREEAGERERVAGAVDVLERSVSRMLTFARQVRSLARPYQLKLEYWEVSHWLSTIESELGAVAGDNVTLTFKESGSRLLVNADRDAMTQVMTNLVANARDAIKGRGHIVVSAGIASRATGTRWVSLSVADTGRGIEPKYLDRMFHAFFTTKTHGTGIGLPLVRNIVTAHHGEIELQSSSSEGTTFVIYLPVVEQSDLPSSDAG